MDYVEITTAEKFRQYTDPETFEKIREMQTVSEMWKHCLSEYADLCAIEDNGIKYSYLEIEAFAARMRAKINENVEGSNKRIALLSTNSINFVAAYIAITTMGHSAIILPAQLDEKSIFGICMGYGAAALVYENTMSGKITLAASKVKAIEISNDFDKSTEMTECKPQDECILMFTSGTTGKSKAAVLSNRAVMVGTVNGCYGYKDVFNQKYILVLPLSHVFGIIRNLMTSLYTGSDLFICHDNKNMFNDIAQFKPNILVTVPAIAELALTLSNRFGRNMLGPDMKTIIAGAAAVAPFLILEYKKLGINMCAGYGLTESANLVSGNPESDKKPESVGLPYPHQQIKLVDGELWLKGDNMMTGYADPTEESFTEDGWFKTGDLARFDEDGYLYITGRSKEIIVLSNGENVSPAEIETVFNRIPFVQDSQVFEDVAESGSHFLSLEIVPRSSELKDVPSDNLESYMMEELNAVNASLPPYQRVSKIVIRDKDFERSPSMKIVRYKKC